MGPTKFVSITARELEYHGDPLGRDFFFNLVIFDQFHFAQSFHMQLKHDEIHALEHKELNLSLRFQENVEQVSIPFAIIAAKEEIGTHGLSEKNKIDFGQNVGVFNVTFRDDVIFPFERRFHLPVEVRGDYFAQSGIGKNKVAQLSFFFDINAHWTNAVNMGPGSWLLEAYKKGQRQFEGAQLQNAYFANTNLSHINLTEANLLWAVIRNTNLSNTRCSGVILRGVHGELANFEKARLPEANLVEANFSGANFSGADLSYAQINTKFIDANLRRTNFFQARINGSSFRNADLTRASFKDAHLINVDFRNAVLKGTDFTGAQIENIDYHGADITDVIKLNTPSTDLQPKDPFFGKSQDFINGFHEGKTHGLQFSSQHEIFDESYWKKSLERSFPNAAIDFAEGYKEAFMEAYAENWTEA